MSNKSRRARERRALESTEPEFGGDETPAQSTFEDDVILDAEDGTLDGSGARGHAELKAELPPEPHPAVNKPRVSFNKRLGVNAIDVRDIPSAPPYVPTLGDDPFEFVLTGRLNRETGNELQFTITADGETFYESEILPRPAHHSNGFQRAVRRMDDLRRAFREGKL